ncbi:MAG: diguanylate cyclase [Methylococcaceae bacterium]|nr:diguanylate cyclase [Methylococcaceae bacterium]
MPDSQFIELKAVERLPSPEGIALKIIELSGQDNVSLEDLAHLIKADQALSAKILKFANSPLIASRRPVVATLDAVRRIGLIAVRNLILGLSLIGKYREGPCRGFDYPRYWLHSLAVAAAMGVLAARQRIIASEEAFTLGLLADIGQLALATAWPEEYARVIEEAAQCDLIARERKHFNLDRRELTRLLLADWKLPEIYCNALAHDRDPVSATDTRTAALAGQLGLARSIADWCLSPEREAMLPGLERQVKEQRFPEEQLPGLLEAIETAWLDWAKLIEVQTALPIPAAKAVQVSIEQRMPGLDIVLVDDDPLFLALMTLELSTAGHRLRTCRNGQQALKEIFANVPQLVLADWSMQPMDGLTLCRTLRQSAIGRDLYLIMLTAHNGGDHYIRAFEAGVDDYVTKPVDFNILQARIRAGQRICALQAELSKEHAELEHRSKALALANRKLEQAANTDLLTGLPNRRYGLHRLDQEFAQAQRYGRPLSVMILDLDHFKSVNDSLGHAAGDEVLKYAARIMQQALRNFDTLCRWGGEEFIAIVPDTGLAAASKLAERLRCALASENPKGLALKRLVTVSIGVAAYPAGRDVEHLLHLADQALYRAKDRGRNRVEAA